MICLEELYIKELEVINGVRFTPREIDVIACLLNGRTAKGTAGFLSNDKKLLGDRAIETHILNIRRKIAGASKDSIIDFVEKSDKHKLVQGYYSDLLIQKEFRKTLQEILPLIKEHAESFLVILYSEKEKSSFLVDRLQNDLKLLAPEVQIERRQDSIPILLPLFSNPNKHYTICIMLKEGAVSLEAIRKIRESEDDSKKTSNNPENSIFLLVRAEEAKSKNPRADLVDIPNVINLTKQKSYYFLFLEIFTTLFPGSVLKPCIDRFQERYDSIQGDVRTVLTEDIISKKPRKIHLYVVIITILVFLLISVGAGFSVYYHLEDTKTKSHSISQILPKFFEDLSVRNLLKEEAERNYNIITHFAPVVEAIISGKIQTYFDVSGLKSEELVMSLYNLNAIASYVLFKEHDAPKAEKILKYSKSLAEEYVSRRGKLQIDFDKLTAPEIYTEISIIPDLPEIYTITVYFLGRSYIYQKNIELAEKCFKLTKYLGKKLDLFEDFLSDINGLEIIRNDKIEIDIKNGNYKKARENLIASIGVYEKSYKPSNHRPETVVPREDIFNVIDCNKRIIKLYTKLLGISENSQEKNLYLEKITKQFKKNGAFSEVLKILTSADDKLSRFAADFYNTLGYLLLKLYDEKLDFHQIRNHLTKQLNLSTTSQESNLQFILQLFDLAKSLSRNTEFTKADSLSGQIETYDRLLNDENLTETEKTQISKQIQEFKKARDAINQKLKRKF
jgi:hypothetical protein